MGRLTELFDYLNRPELPSAAERQILYTHINPEDPELKKLRREYRKNLRKNGEDSPEGSQGALWG